jgi:hypothetical protein
MSRCNCGTPDMPPVYHSVNCPLSPAYELEHSKNPEIQLRPRTPKEYRAYVQGFLYGHKMTEEARHNLPTEIALETIVEGYRQMVGYPGRAREGESN